MAEHNLQIKASIDTSQIQSQLDKINGSKSQMSGNGSQSNATRAIQNLQRSIDRLNATIQRMATGAASSGSAGNIGTAALAYGIGGLKASSPQSIAAQSAVGAAVATDIAKKIVAGAQREVNRAYNQAVRKGFLPGQLLSDARAAGYGNNVAMYAAQNIPGVEAQLKKWTRIQSTHAIQMYSGVSRMRNAMNMPQSRDTPMMFAGSGKNNMEMMKKLFAAQLLGGMGDELFGSMGEMSDASLWWKTLKAGVEGGIGGFMVGGPKGAILGLGSGLALTGTRLQQQRAKARLNDQQQREYLMAEEQNRVAAEHADTLVTPGEMNAYMSSVQKSLDQNKSKYAGMRKTYSEALYSGRHSSEDLKSMQQQMQAFEAEYITKLQSIIDDLQAKKDRFLEEEQAAADAYTQKIEEERKRAEEIDAMRKDLYKQREAVILELEQQFTQQGVDLLDSMAKTGKYMSDFARNSLDNKTFNPLTQKLDGISSKLDHLASIDRQISEVGKLQ